MGAIVVIIFVSSFYIYQRVWVRRLISQNDRIQRQTEQARLNLAGLERQWAQASSLTSVEAALEAQDLPLRPTAPSQNLILQPPTGPDSTAPAADPGKYAGLVKALDKLKSHLPVVTDNEANAEDTGRDK